MPIQVNIVSQKYYREFINGTDFSSNTSEFTQNLVGSVMEKVRANIQIAISWAYFAASEDGSPGGLLRLVYLEIYDTDKLIVERKDGGDFEEDGFYPGQTVRIRAGNNYYADKTIISVNGNRMNIDLDGVTTLGSIAVFGVFGDEPLTALVQNFGIIGNDETFNTESKVSGNNQGYYGVDIGLDSGGGRSTTFVDMIRLGKYKDWISGSSKVRYVENTVGIFNTGSLQTAQVFEIQHEFIINPWYLQGQLENFQNNVIPDDLAGQDSYKYVFDCSFREVISNPNSAIEVSIEDVLGSVAWFGESFNGFQNDYNIVSITFEDASSNSADGILISGETNIQIEVEKISGSFNSGDTTGVYISFLPNQEAYTDTIISDLKENFIYDRALVDEGATAESGDDFISSIESNIDIGTGNMIIDVVMEYSATQAATLSEAFNNNNGNFLIAVQTGDTTLTAGNSDSVLNYYIGEYDQSPDIQGLIDLAGFGMFPLAGDPDVVGSYSSIETWIEDGVLCEFALDLDLSLNAVLNSLEVVCVAYNSTTGQYFQLDSFPINLNPIIKNGIQEINTSERRGYILSSNDPYNEVYVNTSTKTGDLQRYLGRFAQKIPWQSWIANPDTDSVFYDTSLDENGLNLKSNRFAGFENYEIHLGLLANLSGTSELGVSGITDYLLLGPSLIVNDYDEDEGVSSVWSAEIKTYNPTTNVELDGGLIDGENTLIRVVWSSTNGAITDISNYFCAIRIEETEQPGYAISELTNVRDAQSGQLLFGSTNVLRLDVSLESGNVVCEALVDGSVKLDEQAYNISAAIREGATPPFDSGFDYVNGFLIN